MGSPRLWQSRLLVLRSAMRSREGSSAEPRRKAAGSRGQRRSPAASGRSAEGDKPPSWLLRWPVLILFVAVIVAYVRILSAGFVVFDDDFHVYANPFLNPPTLSSFARFWEHSYKELYVPLAYTVFASTARF